MFNSRLVAACGANKPLLDKSRGKTMHLVLHARQAVQMLHRSASTAHKCLTLDAWPTWLLPRFPRGKAECWARYMLHRGVRGGVVLPK